MLLGPATHRNAAPRPLNESMTFLRPYDSLLYMTGPFLGKAHLSSPAAAHVTGLPLVPCLCLSVVESVASRTLSTRL